MNRHVLERVHRDVRLAFEQRHLELLHEQALAADLRKRRIEQYVALGAHGLELDLETGMGGTQPARNMFRLPHGEATFAGGDSYDAHCSEIHW